MITAAATAAQQQIESSRQRRFQAEQAREQKRIAALQARLQSEQIAVQQIADTEQASLEVESNRRAAAAAKSSATVTAGEVGAFGRGYEALLGQFSLQSAEFESSVRANLAIRNQFASLNLRQSGLTLEAARMNARYQVTRPNYLNAVIGGLNVGLSVDSAYRSGGGGRGGRPAGFSGPLRADGTY